MIESMISDIKPYLPLKISEANWDGTSFYMYGPNWGFHSLSVWRIVTDAEMIFGCYDKESEKLVNLLNGLLILDIDFQDDLLKIDPVFILSNGQRLEIFSTDTFEPWTFGINDVIVFVPTPAEPELFQ